MKSKKQSIFEKNIFLTGEYINHFTPDDKKNPFTKIYNKKKFDTIKIINKSATEKRILDVGGGMGRLSLALAESSANNVVLTDISIDMLKLACKYAGVTKPLKVCNADGHFLPFCDNSFDIIVGLDLLCHLTQPRVALAGFHRILKDNGLLIFDSTNSNPLWAFFYRRYIGMNPINWIKIIKYKGVLPGWEKIVNHYPKATFHSFIQNAGFKVIQFITYGPILCPKWHLAIAKKELK